MQILMVLLTQFGPAIGGLLANLAERAITGWKSSAVKTGGAMAGIMGLLNIMGCDMELGEQAAYAAIAASPLLLSVPSNQIVPTLTEAITKRVEAAKQSRAVMDAAVAEQKKWTPPTN